MLLGKLLLLMVSVGICHGQVQECLSMHLLETTYRATKQKADEMTTIVQQLRAKLDESIKNSCGRINGSVTRYPFHVTYCDFEDDSSYCTDDSLDSYYTWEVRKGYIDHTTGSTKGHVLRSSGSRRFESFEFKTASSYCIRFFYRTDGDSDFYGTFNVYLKEGTDLGVPIWHRENVTRTWTFAEISPEREYLRKAFQLAIEVKGGQYILIDDLTVYDTDCRTLGVREPRCPVGSYDRTFGNITKCYTFHLEPMTWVDAIKRCKEEWPLSNLVSLETPDEDAYIRGIIQNNTAMRKTVDFGIWTGGYDIDSEGNYTWPSVVGEPKPFTYSNWHHGQPNNIGGDQDCIVLQYPQSGIQWGDVDCSERHAFICEADYIAGSHLASHPGFNSGAPFG